MNALLVGPALCQAPQGQKEGHSPYSKRTQTKRECTDPESERERELGKSSGKLLAAGTQKRKASQERLNEGSELGLSHEQSLGLELQKEGRCAFRG